MEKLDRKITVANFYGKGKLIFEDELGWQELQKEEK